MKCVIFVTVSKGKQQSKYLELVRCNKTIFLFVSQFYDEHEAETVCLFVSFILKSTIKLLSYNYIFNSDYSSFNKYTPFIYIHCTILSVYIPIPIHIYVEAPFLMYLNDQILFFFFQIYDTFFTLLDFLFFL